MLLDNKLAFICFRKPDDNDTTIFVFTEKDIHYLNDYNELDSFSGFIFHPFISNKKKPVLLINPEFQFNSNDKLTFIKENILPLSFSEKQKSGKSEKVKSTSKNEYFEQISKMIKSLKERELKKVVLSRREFIAEITIDKAPEIFTKLESNYKNAFVYFLHIPGQCSWMGASPELFFQKKEETCKTVALAATILNRGQTEINWGEKEKTEQALVSEYLESVLKANGISDYNINGPSTVKAGNLFHLKTEFLFPFESVKGRFGNLLKHLHATPAVCGLPKNNALRLINKTENYDREYYTGFLGLVNNNGESHLFVNLRCLQFVDDGAVLYTGGGITADSIPEKEWEETIHKAQTLLSVMENFQTFAGK